MEQSSRDGEAPVRTVSQGVGSSYYGLPVIRAPNWHWLVVAYLFLGGIAGGSYSISVLADWFGDDGRLARVARYVSMAAFVPSPALLALDLGRPDRALHMLRIVKLRSPLSLGSWAMTLLGGFLSTVTGLQLLSDLTGREVLPGVRRAVGLAGLPVGLFFSGYTGLLLAISNVPVWARNSLLWGPTFLCSAFSTSFAAISLALRLTGGERPDTVRKLARAEVICQVTELSLLLAGVARLGRLGRPLTTGVRGLIFWPVTIVGGLVAPSWLLLSGPLRGRPTSGRRGIVTSGLVLVGGFGLRTAMILAGHRSAELPEDYFEFTKLSNG